jgi:hypothetical protein
MGGHPACNIVLSVDAVYHRHICISGYFDDRCYTFKYVNSVQFLFYLVLYCDVRCVSVWMLFLICVIVIKCSYFYS